MSITTQNFTIYVQAKKSFLGHQVIRARVETAAQAQLLGPALEEYDLWSEVGVSSSLDIHVAPHQNTSLARLLDTAGVQYRQTCKRCWTNDISLCFTTIRMSTKL